MQRVSQIKPFPFGTTEEEHTYLNLADDIKGNSIGGVITILE